MKTADVSVKGADDDDVSSHVCHKPPLLKSLSESHLLALLPFRFSAIHHGLLHFPPSRLLTLSPSTCFALPSHPTDDSCLYPSLTAAACRPAKYDRCRPSILHHCRSTQVALAWLQIFHLIKEAASVCVWHGAMWAQKS